MAQDMYLSITDVKGESTEEGFVDFINVLDWDWGVKQHPTLVKDKGLTAGKAEFSNFSVIYYIDNSVPTVLDFCASGQSLKKVEFVCRKNVGKSGDKPKYVNYWTLVFEDAMITNVDFLEHIDKGVLNSGDTYKVKVDFAFTKYAIKYIPVNKENITQPANVKTGNLCNSQDVTSNSI